MAPVFDIYSFPMQKYKRKGTFAVIIILLVSLLAYVFTKQWLMPILAMLVMAMPLVNFLLPSRTLFFEDYFDKEQLFTHRKLLYSEYDETKTMHDGVLLIKKTSKSGEFFYIFDNEIKNAVAEFLKIRLAAPQQ